MHVSEFDSALWIASCLGQLVLLVILIKRRLYQVFPFFTGFILWAALSDPLLLGVLMFRHDAYSTLYYRTYFTINIVQYGLEIGVLVEIAANVLSKVRKTLSNQILIVLFGCMGLIGGTAFFVAVHINDATLSHIRAFFVIDTSMAILRLVTFLLIAVFSQVLGLNWRNHVLQLASGLAFYSAVSLTAGVAHSFLHAEPDYAQKYREIAQLAIVGYLCALYYWCFSFARQEAPRKEFNSKMSDFLISMNGPLKQQQSIVARKHR